MTYILPKAPTQTGIESLEFIGIGKKDIIWHDNNIDLEIKTMYTISRMASMYNYFSNEFFSVYDDISEQVLREQCLEADQLPKLLYISRRDSTRRKCLNEDMLEKELEKLGFSILVLQGMTFKERIELFANAQLVVGAAGAGLVHMIFMKENSHVIALGSEQMHKNSSAFSKIAMQKNINFAIISSDDVSSTQSPWVADVNSVLEYATKVISKNQL